MAQLISLPTAPTQAPHAHAHTHSHTGKTDGAEEDAMAQFKVRRKEAERSLSQHGLAHDHKGTPRIHQAPQGACFFIYVI